MKFLVAGQFLVITSFVCSCVCVLAYWIFLLDSPVSVCRLHGLGLAYKSRPHVDMAYLSKAWLVEAGLVIAWMSHRENRHGLPCLGVAYQCMAVVYTVHCFYCEYTFGILFGWGTKVYVQNWSEPSNDILHCFCLTRGSTLTSQDYSPSSVVCVPKLIRAIWRYLPSL